MFKQLIKGIPGAKYVYRTLLPLIKKPRIRINAGDNNAIGQSFLRHFQEIGNIQPNDRILDVGCGTGRMANALKSYLNPDAEYYGFDIMSENIKDCKNRIPDKNFNFSHVDVYNKHYNPKGKIKAEQFKFPFNDNYFDFIILTSVFTHMLTADMKNYISEISRVLKTNGGRCFVTYFILNKESEDLIKSNPQKFTFNFQIDSSFVESKDDPEAAVAFKEDFIRKCFEEQKLNIVNPIHYGSWCSRQTFLSYQDVIVANKIK
jgi:ubiquinone/menaquinone biosynthesis C-methylase UbiE